MTILRVNGVGLHVKRFRRGPEREQPIVVLIHGAAVVSGSSWGFILGLPLATDAEVICYDLRGHGRSEQVTSGYRVADHVADLMALLDALDIHVPVHIGAASFGGAIAVTAAARHPERVASLFLVDCPMPVDGWDQEVLTQAFSLVDPWVDKAEADGEGVIQGIMDHYGVGRRRAAGMVDRVQWLFRQTTWRDDALNEPVLSDEEWDRITCPVLGVYGADSHYFSIGEKLPKVMPHARVHVVPGVNHWELFRQWGEIRTLGREFFGLPRNGSDTSAGA
jgi:pimeloyl-ACP methyl ester carboxylesterase